MNDEFARMQIYEAQMLVTEKDQEISKLKAELEAERKINFGPLSSAVRKSFIDIATQIKTLENQLDKLDERVEQLQIHQVQSSSEISELVKDLPRRISEQIRNELKQFGSLNQQTGQEHTNKKNSPPPQTQKVTQYQNLTESVVILGGTSKHIFVFNNIEAKWKRISITLPNIVNFHGSAVLDGEIYIIGGYKNGVGTSDHFKLNKNLHWVQLTSLPESRSKIGNSTVVYKGCIWVIGGDSNQIKSRNTDLPFPARTSPSFYYSPHSSNYQNFLQKSGTNNPYKYCPKTNTWTEMPELNYLRPECAAAVADDKIFVFGGNGCDTMSTMLYPIEFYAPDFNRWINLDCEYTSPRYGLSLVVTKRFIYIFGGRDKNGSVKIGQKMNITEKRNENLLPTSMEHDYCQAVSMGNEFWLLGASISNKNNSQPAQKIYQCEVYNGTKWEQTPAPPVENFSVLKVPIELAKRLLQCTDD